MAQRACPHDAPTPLRIGLLDCCAKNSAPTGSASLAALRVDGGQPFYGVLEDAGERPGRQLYQQDLWHCTVAKMVDACQSNAIKAFYGPFGDLGDGATCEAQFRNAFLQGCVGAWTLHPSQIEIAKRVFSPEVDQVRFAARILEAMPDGTGVTRSTWHSESGPTVDPPRRPSAAE